MVVEAVDFNSVANNDLLNRDYDWKRQAENGDDAIDIANNLWNNNCFRGVHVIRRSVDEWTETNFEDRMRQFVGSAKTIILWAIQGNCEKAAQVRTPDKIIQFLQ